MSKCEVPQSQCVQKPQIHIDEAVRRGCCRRARVRGKESVRKYDAELCENTTMASSKPQAKHSMFDLEKQYIFYASYHNNPVNVLIHLVCIWNIAASGLVFFQYTPSLAPMPGIVEEYVGTGLSVNVALILCLFYSVVYLRMEPFLGFIGELFCMYRVTPYQVDYQLN